MPRSYQPPTPRRRESSKLQLEEKRRQPRARKKKEKLQPKENEVLNGDPHLKNNNKTK